MRIFRPVVATVPVLLAGIGIVVALRGCADDPLLESRTNWHRGATFAPTTPAMFSDGHFLLFDSARTGNGDIYRLNRADLTLHRLTDSPQLEFHPVLSKDDRQVAFTRETGGYQHIWTMSLDGTNQKQVTHGAVLDYVKAFSSDGVKVFFVRTTWQNRALLPRRALMQLQLTGPESGTVTAIGEACAISPDEKTLLGVDEREPLHPQIWSMRRDGPERRSITQGTSPSLSPDGKRIVYLHQNPDYETELMTMEADGIHPEKLPGPRGVKTAPEFCLEGRAIIFRVQRSERFDTHGTYLISLETQKAERLKETD